MRIEARVRRGGDRGGERVSTEGVEGQGEHEGGALKGGQESGKSTREGFWLGGCRGRTSEAVVVVRGASPVSREFSSSFPRQLSDVTGRVLTQSSP